MFVSSAYRLRRALTAIAALAIVVAVSCAPQGTWSAPPASGQVWISTHGYGPEPVHGLDIYHPPGTGPFPVLVWINVGGWSTSQRYDVAPVILGLPEAGIAVASITVRLPDGWGGGLFPSAVIDAKSAVGWLARESSALGIDPHRILIGGLSAGGEIATLAATSFGNQDIQPFGGPEVPVAGIVDLSGPPLLSPFLDTPLGAAVRAYLGCPEQGYCPDPDRAGVLRSLDQDDPPLLGIYGDTDIVVPQEMGWGQHLAALAAGMDSTFMGVPGGTHDTTGWMADFQGIVRWILDRSPTGYGDGQPPDTQPPDTQPELGP